MDIKAKEIVYTNPSGVTATSTSLSPIFCLKLSVVHSSGEGKSSANAFFNMHGRPRFNIRPKDVLSRGPEWTSTVDGVTSGYKETRDQDQKTYDGGCGHSYGWLTMIVLDQLEERLFEFGLVHSRLVTVKASIEKGLLRTSFCNTSHGS